MSFTSSKPEIQLPEFHPIANIFPLMVGDEFDELKGDMQRRGFRINVGGPIWMYEGKILDGRNRPRACVEAGVMLEDIFFKTFEGTREEATRVVIQANIHRRHLKPDDRREFLKQLLGMNPDLSDLSDRAIAKITKTHHHAVATARKEAGNGKLSHKHRLESSGRKARGHKPGLLKPRSNSAPAPSTRLLEDAWNDATAKAKTAFITKIGLPHLFSVASQEQQEKLANMIREMDRLATTDAAVTSIDSAIAAH
jgi:hypothetical protein